MKNKLLALLLTAIFLISSLPSCAGDKKSPETENTDTSAEKLGTEGESQSASADTSEAPSVGEDSTEAPPDEDQEHPLAGKLVINEVCSSNKTCLHDGRGNYYDWIELLNTSNETLQLSGIGLSKKSEEPYTLKMPKMTLAPGTFLTVFCNKNEKAGYRNSNLFAPFNIGADGETLYLTAPAVGDGNGELLDTVTVPKMKSDDAYGRGEDGVGTFKLLSPTPNKSNRSAKEVKYISAPSFSAESGFYADDFELEISSKGGTVYYTTDCSDPLTSDNAEVYRAAIEIEDASENPNVASAEADITLNKYSAPDFKVDKCTVVRAVAIDGDGFASEVITKTYFVGKTADAYADLPVVSVSSDHRELFSGSRGIYVVGDSYYEWASSADYVEYSTADKKNPTNYNQEGREWEREAHFQMFEDGKAVYGSDCGLRIAGNWSRHAAQKSLRLYARGEYGDSKFTYPFFEDLRGHDGKIIGSYDKLTLSSGGNDWQHTKLINTVVADAAADLEIDTMASRPCVLFLNGEFWGMYFLCEKQEDEYLESHYGAKAEETTVIKNGRLEGDKSLLEEYKKTVLWALEADMTDPEALEKVAQVIDLQSLADYIAVETYVINTDWSKQNGVNNWMLWRSNETDPEKPYCDGKWRFSLFDVDASCKKSPDTDLLSNMNRDQKWSSFSALFYKLCENSDFMELFYESAAEIIEENFDPDRVNGMLDAYAEQCRPMLELTYARYGLGTNFNSKLAELKSFFSRRPELALSQLKGFCSAE